MSEMNKTSQKFALSLFFFLCAATFLVVFYSVLDTDLSQLLSEHKSTALKGSVRQSSTISEAVRKPLAAPKPIESNRTIAHEFHQPERDEDREDPVAAIARNERSAAAYNEAMANRHVIPVIGDRFFQFFYFEPTKFYQPLF